MVVEYEDQGSGDVILLLHGWGNNLHSFDEILENLGVNYRVVALDLPGFGKSQMPDDWNLNDYINCVKDFCQKLAIIPDILVGHSFGGRIIIKGIAEKKFTAQKLVLLAPAGVSKNGFYKKILKVVSKLGRSVFYIPPFLFWRNKIKKIFYKKIGSDFLDQGKMKKIFELVVGEKLDKYAKKINIPVLLVWGKEDTVTPLVDGKLLSSLISGSSLKIVSNAGHFVHQEQSKEVSNLIKDFIKL